jgi:hypothetical protein
LSQVGTSFAGDVGVVVGRHDDDARTVHRP